MKWKEPTQEEIRFIERIIKKVLEEYPEIEFVVYPKRRK